MDQNYTLVWLLFNNLSPVMSGREREEVAYAVANMGFKILRITKKSMLDFTD